MKVLFELRDHGPQSDGGAQFESIIRHPHVGNATSVFHDDEQTALEQGQDILRAIAERRYEDFWVERGEAERNLPLSS